MSDIPRKRQTKKPDIENKKPRKAKAPHAPGKKDPKETQFKKGNKVWQMREFPGRKTAHENAEALWEDAVKYFEWAINNPLDNYVIQAGKRIFAPSIRAFTLYDLCHHMGRGGTYLNDIEDRVIGKTDPNKEGYSKKEADFSHIVKVIREVIYNQKYQGAAAGHFKENLIARDIGLHESVNNKLYSGNDEPLKSQISIIQLPDNGRPVNIPGITKE